LGIPLGPINSLEPLGIPLGPINSLAQVFEHPQVQSRQMRIDVPHPLAGTVPQVASPIKMSETPPQSSTAPPLLGEHTNQVLQQRLGLSSDDIDRLRAAGVIG